MKKFAAILLVLLAVFAAVFPAAAEDGRRIVAKVTTKKGALKMRASAGEKSRVLNEIPNGSCLLVLEEDGDGCRVSWRERTGYCRTGFLTLLREADPSMLNYRVLSKGDKGEDVLALKKRLQELGYIRGGSDLTNVYNDVAAERVTLFQRQAGMTEDGIASQELQAYLFSDKAPVCGQPLPRARSPVMSKDGSRRVICGCCMGEGCECCHFTGWIDW